MSKLVWDDDANKIYELGLDRGVLYLDNTGIPWNGLVSIEMLTESSIDSIYFDGKKIGSSQVNSVYSSEISALTFPDAFLNYSGYLINNKKLEFANQKSNSFGLSYRTLIGDAIFGMDFAYKLHIVYNLIATPSSEEYETIGDDINNVIFKWKVKAIPERLKEHNDTAYAIIDSRYLDPSDLLYLETLLYGSPTRKPRLPSLSSLIDMIPDNVTILIIDNNDGTWTAEGPDELITMLDSTTFQIEEANAIFLSGDSYTISSS